MTPPIGRLLAAPHRINRSDRTRGRPCRSTICSRSILGGSMRQPLSLLGTRARTALLLAMAAFALPVAARAQVVHHDFEDGTTQGWFPRGTAILAVTNEAAATGLNSLKTTGRTAPWNGPS